MNKQFVYIDSSQEQDNTIFLKPIKNKKQQLSIGQQQSPKQASPSKYRKCCSNVIQNNVLVNSQYDILVKNLLNQKISKQVQKKLLTNIEDTQLVHNINKRNKNYQFFLQKIEIDHKYNAMQQEKVSKLKEENQRKKIILQRHQSQNQLKQQRAQLIKYKVQRNQKQERVVNNVKKHIKKLGFERIYNAHKKIKQQIRQKQKNQQNQLQSRLNKQRNQLLQLQQMYEQIKQEKKINKMEQRKVIKQLTEKVWKQKQGFKQKYAKKQTFQV